ncbi:hypothetical protein [Sphingomonas trueperi]|uniref:hypothetical protein n=1 Tax=Sphingomonas trueperi TaxID=53317 RepID=UPI000F267024
MQPSAKTFDPLFAIRMDVFAIAAMNGPDWPGGNITLVGRLNGQLTIIVLEIAIKHAGGAAGIRHPR